jgi:hypothetical protein
MRKRCSCKGAAVPRALENEAEGIAIFISRYQETSSEDSEGWKRLSVCDSDVYSVELSGGPIIKCYSELCVKVVDKFNIQSKTRSRVTLIKKFNTMQQS